MDILSRELRLFFLPIEGNGFYPYSLRRKALVFYVTLALLFKLFSFPLVTMFPKTDLFAAVTANSIIQLTNQAREARGIAQARENSTLNRAAEEKALDMVREKYFAHTSPQGKTPWFWFLKNGYGFKYAGENLAIDFLQADDVVKAWLTSDLHRENLLNPNYQDVGVAVVAGDLGGRLSILAVQFFGSERSPLTEISPQALHPSSASITLSKAVGFLAEPGAVYTGLALFIFLALLLATFRQTPIPVPSQALIGGILAFGVVVAMLYLPSAGSFYGFEARIF